MAGVEPTTSEKGPLAKLYKNWFESVILNIYTCRVESLTKIRLFTCAVFLQYFYKVFSHDYYYNSFGRTDSTVNVNI